MTVFADSSVGLDIFTDGTTTLEGAVSMDDASADTILIGQNGATADTVTVAGNVSLTDSQWSVTSVGAATFVSMNGLSFTGTGSFDVDGALTLPDDLLFVGAFPVTVNVTGVTDITFPTTGTLLTDEPNQPIDSPIISGTPSASAVTWDGLGIVEGATPISFEGATTDGNVTIFSVANVGADQTITFPGASGTLVVSANAPLAIDVNGNVTCATCVTDVNSFETFDTTSGTNPVAESITDTLTLTAGSGNITVTGDALTDTITLDIADSYLFNTGDTATGVYDFTGAVLSGASPIVFEGSSVDANETTFAITNPTGSNTITFPNASIAVNAAADISGTTLASNVVSSSLTSVGTLLSLTVSGLVEADGGLVFDSGATITGHLSTLATNVTSASIGAGSCGNYATITVTGAAVGDTVVASPDFSSSASGIEDVNLSWSAGVSSTNSVTIRACNPQAIGAVNAGDDQEWRVDVWQH